MVLQSQLAILRVPQWDQLKDVGKEQTNHQDENWRGNSEQRKYTEINVHKRGGRERYILIARDHFKHSKPTSRMMIAGTQFAFCFSSTPFSFRTQSKKYNQKKAEALPGLHLKYLQVCMDMSKDDTYTPTSPNWRCALCK